MKQVLLGNRIHVEDVPVPGLGPGEVLVEVAYSFISTGTELAGVKSAGKSIIGKIKEHPQRIAQVMEMIRVNGVRKTVASVQMKLETRTAPGYSASGRVIATGRNVGHLVPGDLVACAGQGYACHAEVVAVPANLVAKLPAGCDLKNASGATLASIALQGVRRAEPRLGETVAVVGLGLLGQLTLQCLAANGVDTIGFDLNPARVAEASNLGFAQCHVAAGKAAVEIVNSLTAQMGADATIISAATDADGLCQAAMEMTRRKGKVVVVGAVPLSFDREPFYRKELDFLISTSYGPGRYDSTYEEGGHDYPFAYVRWTENRNMQAVLQLIAGGKLRMDSLIAAEYPAAEAEAAFDALNVATGDRPLAVVLKYDWNESVVKSKLSPTCVLTSAKPVNGRIGVGIVGVGQFCRKEHLPNLAAQSDRYQIVGVCDKVGSAAQDVGRQYAARLACTDVDELIRLDDAQLIMIGTRHDTHADLAMRALRAGKHVFVEKPMAMNANELGELLRIIESSQRLYMVGFNRRFSRHIQHVKHLLRRRQGPTQVLYRVLADPAPHDSWIYSTAGGGRAIGEACHMLDLLNYIVGDEIAVREFDVVCCPAGTAGPPSDNFVATIGYEDGSVGTLVYTTLGRQDKLNGKERIEVMWDRRSFVVDDFVLGSGFGCQSPASGGRKGKGHFEELQSLASGLTDAKAWPIPLSAMVRATEMSFTVDAVCRGHEMSPSSGRISG